MRKSAKQPSIVEHFDLEDRDARPIPYSDKAFETAALEWLIETNQVLTRQFHFYVVLICTTFTAHPSVQERHVQEDARHRVSSQLGHSPSLTQAVKVSYSHDVQAATALVAGTPQCAFTCLVFLHSLTFSLGPHRVR